VNAAKALGVTGGLGIGIAGIGGAVDIGVIRNDTAAFIAEGAEVHALSDVDLLALSVKDVHTLAVAAAGGIVGAVGSVSVWTIGSEFESSYEVNDESRDALTTNNGSTYPSVQSFTDAMAGGKISGGGFSFIVRGYSLPEFNPSSAVDAGEDTIDLGPNHGLNQGDAVIYRNGGGESIGGLEDGKRYFIIRDSDNSNLVRLAASQREAKEGAWIDLDTTSTTGSHHRIEPYVGATARSAGNSITEGAPDGEVGGATSSAQVPNGTSAYVASNATIIAGGDVAIHSADYINYVGQTGSVAVGAVGIGGSVTIANIQSHTDAHIGSGAIVLGGGIANAIVVEAFLVEHVAGAAFAGQAGLLAIGAQVVVVNDNSTQTGLRCGRGQHWKRGILSVLAGADRTVLASATGGGIGATALGAALPWSMSTEEATRSSMGRQWEGTWQILPRSTQQSVC
jgi:hypothetical protein